MVLVKSTFVCQVEGQEDITGKQYSDSHFNYYLNVIYLIKIKNLNYFLCVGALSEVKFVCHMYISAL